MEGYHAYLIGSDDHVIYRVDVLTDDETEARRLAKRLVERTPVELWQGTRRLERFEPD